MTVCSFSASIRPSAAVGSSITIVDACRAIARKISVFCWSGSRIRDTTWSGGRSNSASRQSARVRRRIACRLTKPGPPRLDAQEHVLGDRHAGHESDLLGDRRDARAQRVTGRMEMLDFPVQADLALVGSGDPDSTFPSVDFPAPFSPMIA